MEKSRKDVFMKKIKLIVAFLLVCVLSIGGAVVVMADSAYSGDFMQIPCDFVDGGKSNVPSTDLPYLYVRDNADVDYFIINPVISKALDSGGYVTVAGSMYKCSSSWARSSSDSLTVRIDYIKGYVSSQDLYDSSGTLVFRKTEVPVVVAARVLPEKVGAEVKVILTIAIGGLALLIGSITLLPKLKKFLVG